MYTPKKNMPSKLLLIIFSTIIANSVFGNSCSSTSSGVNNITTNCSDLNWTAGNVNVIPGVTVSSSSTYDAVVVGSGTVGNFSNSGNVSGNQVGFYNLNGGSVNSFVNNSSGSVSGSIVGIYNLSGSIGSIDNVGSITSSNFGIVNVDTIGSITNSGSVIVGFSGLRNEGSTLNSFVNSGTFSGSSYGIENFSSISTLTNSAGGVISSSGGTGIFSYATSSTAVGIGSIFNNGTISGTNSNPGYGINNSSGIISNIQNTGTGLITAYIGIQNGANGTISSITNTANITGIDYGIVNYGTITTINNSQGMGNANGALTFYQNLPSNYNIIINSSSSYGRLNVNGASGSMTFGIYGGGVTGVPASVLTRGVYASVLSGVALGELNNTSGTYNGLRWSLSETNTVGGIWDLVVGPTTADTQTSLINTASSLQNIYTLQNSVLANSFSYDCNMFGTNDVCISAGGRNTAVSAANGLNNTSALLIAGYRINPQYRIGAYADQNLSVNNAGSGVMLGNNTPLVGVFGAWNERTDDLGTEVKVSAAYGQKNTTITRAVVGTSEAGSGSSQLNSQGAQLTAKYGFGVAPDVIVSPYVGMRYTQNNMGGYTEAATSSVTAPLTYSALNTNATTALAGVGAQYKFIPQAAVFASAGVETDTNTSNGTYSATGITGLTPINFNANPVKTRPTASLGAYYDVEKNQRIGLTGIYRQEPYQAVSTTTVMATYTIGL